MKRILINGNLGYIGPIVVDYFRKNYPGTEIIGFDSGFFAGCLVNPNVFPERDVNIQYFGDVRSFPKAILSGVDAVVQLAAVSNDPMGKFFERPTRVINNEAVVKIAKLSKEMGVKNFIFASSCSVYGAGGSEAKHERSELNPQTTYAISKIECEKSLSGLADENFIITALRFATACGFSPRLRLDLVLNDFVASGYLKRRIEILSDGTPLRPLIHVKDMARAIGWASTRKLNNGGHFLVVNVGSNGWNYQIKELAEKVKDIIGNIEISINPNAVIDTRSYRVDFSLYSELASDFIPRVTLDDAVKEILAGLSSEKSIDLNFRQSHFIRLRTLNFLLDSGFINDNLNWNLNTTNDI